MRRAVNDLLGAYDKLIMDPVHGGIPLYRHEIQVIDHPLFQRLRNICQNDILSLVFPGATHSRFLHSIGVMHVGTRMFRAMIDAYLRERQLSEQEAESSLSHPSNRSSTQRESATASARGTHKRRGKRQS